MESAMRRKKAQGNRSRSDGKEGARGKDENDVAAVSLFSGAGGFCEGARLAGWKIACAVETDMRACTTYAANFTDVPLYRGDIARFLLDGEAGMPLGANGLAQRRIDVVYGGPPCQGFSQIGPRNPDDPRNRLYEEFVRVVETLKPRAFVLENVPNMMAMDRGRFKERIFEAFRQAGYSVAAITVMASEFGVPQHRRRTFIFGLDEEEGVGGRIAGRVQTLMDTLKTAKRVTVREAIGDLPEEVSMDDGPLAYPAKAGSGCSGFQEFARLDCDHPMLSTARKRGQGPGVEALHNHHTKGMGARRRKIVAALKPGARGDALPSSLWSGKRGHKWRRLDPDKPSYTILAQMHRDLSEWIHPEHDRWITVREAARLQSFHDGFVFHGSESQQLKQVGNAVPPLMGWAAAQTVTKLLEEGSHRIGRR